MRNLTDAAGSQALDTQTIETWKLETGVLMESAAARMAIAFEACFGPAALLAERGIVALAGGGNNGGDALAMLRHLSFAGYRVDAALVPERHPKALAARHAASLEAGGIPVLRWNSEEGKTALDKADIVIDGIAGTGLEGPLSGEPAEMTRALATSRGAHPKLVVAVDLPSGFREGSREEDTRVRADYTLSIEPAKRCLFAPSLRPLAGEIIPVAGVFPSERLGPSQPALLDTTDIDILRRPIPAWAHKGSRGRLAILAGSPGMAGALSLAARAAQAAGAGLVSVFVDDRLFEALCAAPPSVLGGAIVRPESEAVAWLAKQDAALVGPGWGQTPGRRALLSRLLAADIPLVIDADGLRLLAEIPPSRRGAPLVLTPHPGEFAALSGRDPSEFLFQPSDALGRMAREWGATVILKAATSWIANPFGRVAVIDGQEAGLAVAGSGDVLAGLAAGLLANLAAGGRHPGDDEVFECVSLAALVHLEAGRLERLATGWFEAASLVSRAAARLGSPLPKARLTGARRGDTLKPA